MRLARDVVRAEATTDAGKLNTLALTGMFLLVAAGGVIDLLEAIVRIGKDNYDSGFPSLLSLLGAYIVLSVLCVFMLVAGGAFGRRD